MSEAMSNTAATRVLEELAEFGRQNDERYTQRGQRMLNITPETGQFLSILIRAAQARRVLEIGTSNGYSTIWLACAVAETGGHVETIEADAAKVALATANFDWAGVADCITLHHGVAIDVLGGLSGTYDLIFLDADRPSYVRYLEHLVRLLAAGGLLVTDNVVSHAQEVSEFLAALRADVLLDTVTVPLGNGEELTYRRG